MGILESVTLLLGLFSVLWAICSFNRQNNLKIFIEFSARYDRIFNGCFNVDDHSEISKNEELSIYKYFELCCEEYVLFKKSFLQKDIWSIWEKKLKSNMRKGKFVFVWEKHKDEFSEYENFSNLVSSFADSKTSLKGKRRWWRLH